MKKQQLKTKNELKFKKLELSKQIILNSLSKFLHWTKVRQDVLYSKETGL